MIDMMIMMTTVIMTATAYLHERLKSIPKSNNRDVMAIIANKVFHNIIRHIFGDGYVEILNAQMVMKLNV